jgi:hypothetical protein
MRWWWPAVITLLPIAAAAQTAEKQVIVTISSEELSGGVVSEIAWDGGTVVIQGIFAKPSGELSAQYFVRPSTGVTLERRTAHTDASSKYWDMKASRLSPTGLGRITLSSDTKMPQYGIGSLERRLGEAVDMGGTRTTQVLRLGDLLLLERSGAVPPYDGETWSWSPPELNRIAYVDQRGDLWVASADGRKPQRLIRGEFTLPAWSDDGRVIAVAERKNGGKRWEISVVQVPQELRKP